jgi:methionyl-tRNA formyltransferase
MTSAKPRLIFWGTPELARTVLGAIAESPAWEVVGVVAQPDRPAGRNLQLQPPPVKLEALSRGIPVWQPVKARDPSFVAELAAVGADLFVVAAYGQILPQSILSLPRFGCLNIHTSLLPRWRGAAPIQWAIATGDKETGVTIMKMDPGMDTGPMVSVVRTPIYPSDTGATLHDRLGVMGAELICVTLPQYLSGSLPPIPQPLDGVTHARKIVKEDGRMDWSLPAAVLEARLRAFTPWPGGFCFLPSEPKASLIKIHAAHLGSDGGSAAPELSPPGSIVRADRRGLAIRCGEGVLVVTELQPEGGKRMTAEQFLAGHRPQFMK